jgi:hypothetical protein
MEGNAPVLLDRIGCSSRALLALGHVLPGGEVSGWGGGRRGGGEGKKERGV